MQKEDLLKLLKEPIGKNRMVELSLILKAQQFALTDLIDLTFHADKDLAFRAAWILENLVLKDPVAYLAEIEYLLSRIKEIKHHSCQRHYAKIVMHLTSAKAGDAVKEKMNALNLEPVVEQCFDWLIDPKIKTAVKNFSADILLNLRSRYPWIKEELQHQMQFLMQDGSAGILSKGRKIVGS